MSSIGSATAKNSAPIWKTFVGSITLIAEVVGALFHIATTEAFIESGSKITTFVNWGILFQPWNLLHGNLDVRTSMAVTFGWFIEIIYLICMTGIERMVSHVEGHGKFIARVFVIGTALCVGVDFWSDLFYSDFQLGFFPQLGFSLVLSFGVFFFGIIGIELIGQAIAEFSQP